MMQSVAMGEVSGKYQFNKGYSPQMSFVVDVFLQSDWKVGRTSDR